MNPIVKPIGTHQQQIVVDASVYYIEHAQRLFDSEFDRIAIKFDLKGKTAGMYKVSHDERVIRYNPYLFSKYFKENLDVTVPHEVAHYIVDLVYGRRNIRPHGIQWKGIMAEFGADASRTCNFDLQGIPQRVYQRFPYRCDCSQHELTSRRHIKIQKGYQRYVCKYCGVQLKPEF